MNQPALSEFAIEEHPTPLTKRLLTSNPGSTVKFTLRELLQLAPCERLVDKWYAAKRSSIRTGVLAVYQIAAQQIKPPLAAEVALLSEQYRDTYEFRCTTCIEKNQLCLRVDPARFLRAGVRCSACVQAGTNCNLDPEQFGLDRPERNGDHENYRSAGSSDGDDDEENDDDDDDYRYAPNPLPIETLDKVNAILDRHPMQFGESMDWGGGCPCDDYEHMFRVMTSSKSTFWCQEGDFINDANEVADWIKQLFGCFPGIIREDHVIVKSETGEAAVKSRPSRPTGDLDMSWSIVIPDEIDSYVFAKFVEGLQLPHTFPASSVKRSVAKPDVKPGVTATTSSATKAGESADKRQNKKRKLA